MHLKEYVLTTKKATTQDQNKRGAKRKRGVFNMSGVSG